MRMDFQPVLGMPDDVVGAPRLGADIILAEDTAGRQQKREARSGPFVSRDIFRPDELALAANKPFTC
ncbi:hypothetical protein AJ87_17365 [Rhizobium yanglingense]|nr:hypothetical protein AJ87_17365 [Rhizobium yanglingense]